VKTSGLPCQDIGRRRNCDGPIRTDRTWRRRTSGFDSLAKEAVGCNDEEDPYDYDYDDRSE
jgi:hypothetical protein